MTGFNPQPRGILKAFVPIREFPDSVSNPISCICFGGIDRPVNVDVSQFQIQFASCGIVFVMRVFSAQMPAPMSDIIQKILGFFRLPKIQYGVSPRLLRGFMSERLQIYFAKCVRSSAKAVPPSSSRESLSAGNPLRVPTDPDERKTPHRKYRLHSAQEK